MASHVVVIDSAARRAQIKVSPNTYLSDVVEEARKKLGASSVNYGLKHNDKVVDLSRTFRLSGLSSGAKLHLVQLSRSVSVVAVALQLPESDGHTRLTDKFPSDTSLWLILRKFEAGVAGGGSPKQNLTARGAVAFNQGSANSGGVFYEKPVIQVMGRELSSFADLQKTLAQLGFNGGSALLRLNFKLSDTPLDKAMEEITAHFKEDAPAENNDGTSEGPKTAAPEPAKSSGKDEPSTHAENPIPGPIFHEEPPEAGDQNQPIPEVPAQDTLMSNNSASEQQETTNPARRSVQVFSPPSSDTPSAALTPHDPAAYVPTIEHAQIIQKSLQERSRPTRLLSEAELAAAKAAETERLQAIQAVEIKIRFPDQSAAVTSFGQSDTAASLYAFVRNECLDPRWQQDKFMLVYSSAAKVGSTAIPDSPAKRLIQHLGMKHKVLVTFKWDDAGGASTTALATKDVLNAERRAEAKTIQQPVVPEVMGQEEEGRRVNVGRSAGGETEEKKSKVPAWLKLGKK